MNSVLIAMLAFAFVGAATPGPVNLLATTTAVQRGSREAFKLVVSASLAYALVVFLSGSVMHLLVEVMPVLEVGLRWAGSFFLLYLAYQIFTAPVSHLTCTEASSSGWWLGAVTQILNPKAWLVAMSGVSLYVVGQVDQQQWLWAFTTVSLVCCLAGVGLWALTGSAFARYLSQPNRQRVFNRTMAIILGASVSMIWY
ncbi:LysE family translocator [Vibrio sp. Hep-1b-8]|uniref:LysE family translocator n=1 Tax=Vibrio sp. Hep-1b-8 TaxID=2144187 RepID=UPI00111059CA|nr:LysE family translocator [Vibrio sp. Hep-1b-8]TMX42032.1 LysE family translocator [Vibrio sp. Hep-1b-8]